MDSIRIKLEFDAELDLPKCWFLVVPSQHRSVAALSKALQTAFKIPTEIRLEMDDFYLLPSSACLGLLQSNDLIHVSSAAPLDVISRSGTAKRSLVDDLPASGTTASEHKVIGKKIKLDSSAYDIQSVSLQSKLAPESVDTASNGECSSGSSTSSSSDEEQEEAPIGKWTDIRERKSDIESSSGSDSSSSSEESSGDSESGAASDEDTETLVNSKKVPQMPKEPISTAKEEPLMNPPLSLIGKNKKKLLPKMLNHERVHQRFEPESPQAPEVVEPIQENRLEYLAPSADQPLVDHQAKVIFSTVNLYDDAQPPKLTAAQRRRLRRKKGKEAQKAQQAPTQDQLDSFIEDITPMFEEEQPAAEAVRNSPIPAPSKPESTITSRIQAESVIHEALPDLTGHPRKGMKIAYKTLELTTDYQPVISDVKEAIVMGLSADKHLITLQRLSNNVFLSNEGEDVPLGKFELPCEEDFHSETSDTVTVDLLSLMSIKVIPS